MVFGQNMSIENLNSMLSKARRFFFYFFLFYMSFIKGVIWASEYSLSPQLFCVGGGGKRNLVFKVF